MQKVEKVQQKYFGGKTATAKIRDRETVTFRETGGRERAENTLKF